MTSKTTMWPMKSLLVIFSLIFLSSYASGHGHHQSDTKKALLDSYEALFQSIKINESTNGTPNNLHMVNIQIGKKTVSLPESVLADTVKASLHAYEETIREHCDCDITKLKIENENKLKSIIKKVVTFLPELGHILSEMLWTEVAGARRYGVVYIVVSTIGEIIDHNISPVPLCKFIAFASRALSDKIKTTAALLTPFESEIGSTTRMKALLSRMKYRSNFRKKWKATLSQATESSISEYPIKVGFWQKVEGKMRKLEIGYSALESFPKDFSEGVQEISIQDEVKLAMTTLSPMQKMWYTDRVIEYFNFTALLLLENGKITKKRLKMNKKNYFKLQWELGAYGAKVDKLKIMLYALSSTSSEKKRDKILSKVNIQLDELLSDFKDYQELFVEMNESWSPISKLNFKERKTFINKKPSTCSRITSGIVNWKNIAWLSTGVAAYHILTSESDVSESW